MPKYFVVAAGGAIGAIARVWVDSTITERLGIRFPYGTLVVNLSACLLLGFSLEFLNQHMGLNPAWRWLIPLGFLGAYSTFSTLEWETFSDIHAGAFLLAGAYITVSIVLGLIGIGCGVWAARAIS